MKRALGIGSMCLAALAGALRCTDDPRAPTELDRQLLAQELSLAKVPTELVLTTDSADALTAQLNDARGRCAECTLLAVNADTARLSLAPNLRSEWSAADQAHVIYGWRPAFSRLSDAGGAARAVVRQHSLALGERELLKPNPHGVLPPLPPPDQARVRRRVHNTTGWGLLLALAVAALVLSLTWPARAGGAADA